MIAKTVDEFVAQLAQGPWFAALGQPVSDPGAPCLLDWDEWKGPESEGGEVIALSPSPGLARCAAGSASWARGRTASLCKFIKAIGQQEVKT